MRYTTIEPMFVQESEHINIGSIVRSELKSQRKSVTWLAQQLGVNRMAVYRIFNCVSIDTSMLFRLSVVLHRNFFDIYSNKLGSLETTNEV